MSDNTKTPGSGGMEYFDLLPPKLRQALADYPNNMDSKFALQQLRSGMTENQLIKMLERMKP